MLMALTASLFQNLMGSHLKSVPKFAPSKEYPYREASGKVCFLCESNQDLADLGSSNCPRCSPSAPLDLSQGQHVLEHVGAHILKDPGIDRSVELCGLCLHPSPLCQFYLSKGKGSKGTLKVNYALTRGCIMKVKFTYKIMATSSLSFPCSNVPIQCPVCPKTNPAVWRYSMKTHFEQNHRQLMPKHKDLWTLSNFETSEMVKIWGKRATVLTKRTRKSKLPPLVVSEDHRVQIVPMYAVVH